MPAMRCCRAWAHISWKAWACICSSASMVIISRSSGCRCCRCSPSCATRVCSTSSKSLARERDNMKVIGLTGSIGMGKSTTAKLFAEAGVPVYDADATVHKVYEGEAVAAVEAAFPGTTANGKVDRNRLSAKVVGRPQEIKHDTKTTDHNPQHDKRQVEIGCVEMFIRMPTGQFYHVYINPERDMPA